jgi:regulator of Ty1 transposition protein 103
LYRYAEVLADDVVENASDPEAVLRLLQAAESALAARRAALEESARCRTEAAQLAREVLTEMEAAAAKETGELDGSAPVAVKVATLRMKATKKAAAAMAKAAAAEAGGSKNPRAAAKPSTKSQTKATPAPAPAPAPDPDPAPALDEFDPFMMDEPYAPEDGGGGEDDEYVPMAPPEDFDFSGGAVGMDVGGGDEMQALLAQAADNPEVLTEVLAGLPEEQRADFEAQLAAAGITPP